MKRTGFYLKISVIALMFISHVTSCAAAEGSDTLSGIKFRKITFKQALEAAKKENKKVFLHGFAEWCHYCMYMKDSVYPNKEVGDFFNANFVSIKMDMEKEGKALCDTLGAHTFPELLFYDSNGEMLHRAAGRKYKAGFLTLGQEALDPKRQMRTFKNKYDTGTATPEEVQFYFRMMEIAGMSAQSKINDYLMKQPDSSFSGSANNWRIIYDILKDPTLTVMKRFIGNKKAFEARYSTDSVNNKLINIYNSYLMQFVQQLDSVNYEISKKSIKRMNGLEIGDKICAYVDLNKMKMKSQWDDYKVESKKFVETYAMDDYRRLNDVANTYYEHWSSDKEMLATAEQWLQRSISVFDNYKGNHLLACVSILINKKEQAQKAADHAIALGQKYNIDYRLTSNLLPVIQKMQ